MLGFCAELASLLETGERLALATVVRTWGPTPREPGTRMAIRRSGGHLGTVGGGCGEAEVVRAGLGALDTGVPCFLRVELSEEVTPAAEAACGGTMEVLVVPWGSELLPVVHAVRAAAEGRRRAQLFTLLGPGPFRPRGALPAAPSGSGPATGGMAAAVDGDVARAGMDEGTARTLLARGGEEAWFQVPVGDEQWWVLREDLEPPPVLLVCGGGHVALPLARMAKILGLQVVVLDDRPSYADLSRFPDADRVICAPFAEALAGYPVDGETHAVVVTRGHRHDLECVRALLGRGAGYLGMIGSRRRVRGVLELLRQEGAPEEELRRLHAPIGLDIGAQTPAEIALAILAEIVLARRGGTGRPLRTALAGAPEGGDGR